ncbi:MAG: hypothetical protein EA359_16450 [Balneolaceae bacterium]|nr:MAG: hypothetical protein EA359_16450 [Balneolaceae bacterium]
MLLLGVFLFSCDTTSTSTVEKSATNIGNSANSVNVVQNQTTTINEAEIKFLGEIIGELDGTTITTFEYSVENKKATPGPVPNNFTLQWLECVGQPIAAFPELHDLSQIDDVFKIQWSQAIPAPPSNENPRFYSITFLGNVPVGTVTTSLIRPGTTTSTGSIAGPVCPTVLPELTFSGSIYIDANEDNIKQPEEYGLENIEVRLYSLNGGDETFIDSVITEEDGEFSLTVNSSGGDFRIKVPANKVDNTYYQAIPVTFLDFTNVTEDVEDIHFAYVLNTEQIIADLLSGEIQKNTRSTQYWAFQLQHAGINRAQVLRNPNVDYTRDQMNELLTLIENTLPNVPEPFKFGPNKIQDALRILRGQKYGDSEVSELMKQLLTAELNVMSNKGAFTIDGDEIILNDPFNRAILIFGEAIACNALGTCPVNGPLKSLATVNGTYAPGVLSFATVSSGTQTLSAFNGTGGIGSR